MEPEGVIPAGEGVSAAFDPNGLPFNQSNNPIAFPFMRRAFSPRFLERSYSAPQR